MSSCGLQIGGFCLVLEFLLGGSATKRAIPSSFCDRPKQKTKIVPEPPDTVG